MYLASGMLITYDFHGTNLAEFGVIKYLNLFLAFHCFLLLVVLFKHPAIAPNQAITRWLALRRVSGNRAP